jgi:hypothetical protein
MTMTYGKSTPTAYTDYEVIQVNKGSRRLGMTMLPGAWLVDSYPILRYVPGYLNQLKQWHKEELQLYRGQIDVVKNEMVRFFSSCYLEAESFLLWHVQGKGTGAGFFREVLDQPPARVRTFRK